MELGPDIRLVVMGILSLIVFGVGYNIWVASLEREGTDRGYMSLIVSLGCTITNLIFGMIIGDLRLVGMLFLCYIASGLPMIIGSIQRHVQARRWEETASTREAKEALPDD